MAGKIECGPITLTYEVVVTKAPVDEQIAALHREATTLKSSNWDAAIACLKQAATLMRKRKGGYTIGCWLRLPVFLQQAGRFTEAVKELERLIKETPARVKNESPPDASTTWLEYRMHVDLKYIYDKMRLVHKREKRYSEAAQYADMSEEHDKRANELWEVLEAEREQDRLAYEAKSAERREHSRLG
jgi:tetratricopeptide (TPR) repeat protein